MDQAPLAEFTSLIDLASARLGGRAIAASDEFFAAKDNLLKPEPAIFIPGKYTEFGKWMDGWESRRKREPGHDWCVIALGRPGTIRGVVVDTSHFKGNQPESCVVEAGEFNDASDAHVLAAPESAWTAITPRTPLKPDAPHAIWAFPRADERRFTHVRLNIHPDGGVARFRVHGEVLPDWPALAASGQLIDLAAAENAGLVIACNDMHFGSRHNLIMPGRAANMGDGWETRRKRGLKGGEYDWAIVQLGHRGAIRRAEVDTNHFKGNFPESCMIEVCDAPPRAGPRVFYPDEQSWSILLPRTKLRADARHFYESELDAAVAGRPCTHARLRMYPDGGISRLRLQGLIA